MVSSNIPNRLVVGVDGTWCTPDGANNSHNTTNVYRILSCVKPGPCIDAKSKQCFNQSKYYLQGIGADNKTRPLSRLRAGYFGHGWEKQIKEAYWKCCTLSASDDEVYLFGFSRGAYVVRAVASLLHCVRALSSADKGLDSKEFSRDYEAALNVYRTKQKQGNLGRGSVQQALERATRPAPKIKFVGCLDTVKAVNDHSLFDISFNKSTEHMRLALALHENRQEMMPEYEWFSGENGPPLAGRSFVQAWFVGAHIDMGGSAQKDGLSLYPLQWMMLESRTKGLAFAKPDSFSGIAPVDNYLDIAMPVGSNSKKDVYNYVSQNGVHTSMQEIRMIHNPDAYEGRYTININRRSASMWPKADREPFEENGRLKGYCSQGPTGTIIHPSVFMILDTWSYLFMGSRAEDLRDHLIQCREQMIGDGNVISAEEKMRAWLHKGLKGIIKKCQKEFEQG